MPRVFILFISIFSITFFMSGCSGVEFGTEDGGPPSQSVSDFVDNIEDEDGDGNIGDDIEDRTGGDVVVPCDHNKDEDSADGDSADGDSADSDSEDEIFASLYTVDGESSDDDSSSEDEPGLDHGKCMKICHDDPSKGDPTDPDLGDGTSKVSLATIRAAMNGDLDAIASIASATVGDCEVDGDSEDSDSDDNSSSESTDEASEDDDSSSEE